MLEEKASTLSSEHPPCVTSQVALLGFILDTRLGSQARNHPFVPRQALARETPDGAELLDWGWRRSAPGKWGGRAGCIQMHSWKMCNSGGQQSWDSGLTSPLQDAAAKRM